MYKTSKISNEIWLTDANWRQQASEINSMLCLLGGRFTHAHNLEWIMGVYTNDGLLVEKRPRTIKSMRVHVLRGVDGRAIVTLHATPTTPAVIVIVLFYTLGLVLSLPMRVLAWAGLFKRRS